MSEQRKAPGSNSLDWLNERIRDEEVSGLRFIGNTIVGKDNILTFSAVPYVPEKPTLVEDGSTPPSSMEKVWSGQMLIGGKPTGTALFRSVSTGATMRAMVAQASHIESDFTFSLARGDVIVSRALSAVGKNTIYESPGVSPPRAADSWPESGARIDCSGFVAWCFRISRKVNHPLYEKVNGGWFETTALHADGLNPTGYFDQVAKASPGCLLVYPDIVKSGKRTQGHIGIAVEAQGDGIAGVKKVVHCSSGNFKKHGDAIRVTNAQPWLARPDSIIIAYAGSLP